MKTKSLWLLLVSLILFSTSLMAETQKPITVKVKGLVCSFCAQGIQDRLTKLIEVKSLTVSLAKKSVILELKPNMVLDDKAIKRAVEEAGYSVMRIER